MWRTFLQDTEGFHPDDATNINIKYNTNTVLVMMMQHYDLEMLLHCDATFVL